MFISFDFQKIWIEIDETHNIMCKIIIKEVSKILQKIELSVETPHVNKITILQVSITHSDV